MASAMFPADYFEKFLGTASVRIDIAFGFFRWGGFILFFICWGRAYAEGAKPHIPHPLSQKRNSFPRHTPHTSQSDATGTRRTGAAVATRTPPVATDTHHGAAPWHHACPCMPRYVYASACMRISTRPHARAAPCVDTGVPAPRRTCALCKRLHTPPRPRRPRLRNRLRNEPRAPRPRHAAAACKRLHRPRRPCQTSRYVP